MADIIYFPPTNNWISVTDFLQDSIKKLEEEKAVKCLIAAKTEDGSVITAYFNCGFGEKQELLGHIQCDIIDQMIRANPDRYG